MFRGGNRRFLVPRTFIPWRADFSLLLEAANSECINFGTHSYYDLDVATQPFSETIWFKRAGVNTTGTLFSRRDASNGRQLTLNAGDQLVLSWLGSGGNASLSSNASTYNDQNWHCVTLSYADADPSNWAMHVDGATISGTPSGTASGTIAGGEFRIGSQNSNGAPFDGNVMSYSLHLGTLSLANHQAIYNSGSPPDLRITGPYQRLYSWVWLGGHPKDNDTQIMDTMAGRFGTPINFGGNEFSVVVP